MNCICYGCRLHRIKFAVWTINISYVAIPLVEDADECSSRPCQNGATCSTPELDMYQCACLTGYTGTNCETGSCGLIYLTDDI